MIGISKPMNKSDLFIGAILSMLTSVVGGVLFVLVFTNFTVIEGLQMLWSSGKLGKLLSLGALINLVLFFALLKKNKELMARGVVLGSIVLTLITLLL
jgi:hypothetical protein